MEVRTNSRIVAMMILYNQDICKKIDERLNIVVDHFESILDMVDEDNLNNQDNLNNKESTENEKEDVKQTKKVYDKNFVIQLVNGVNEHLDDIDYDLSVAIEKYTLDRISYVDRSLLRIGAYEIIYTDTPKNIVINEIINISKVYSEIDSYKTSKFNNAILDKLNKQNSYL